MATLNQFESNRLNAQKSTGPRTPAGKEASRFNALKHGIDARCSVIPGEMHEDLEALAVEYQDQLHPETPVERYLVDTLIYSDWCRRRLMRAQARPFGAPAGAHLPRPRRGYHPGRRRARLPHENFPATERHGAQLPPCPYRTPPRQRGTQPAAAGATAGTRAKSRRARGDFPIQAPANGGNWVRSANSRLQHPVVRSLPCPNFQHLRTPPQRRTHRRTRPVGPEQLVLAES